MKALTPF